MEEEDKRYSLLYDAVESGDLNLLSSLLEQGQNEVEAQYVLDQAVDEYIRDTQKTIAVIHLCTSHGAVLEPEGESPIIFTAIAPASVDHDGRETSPGNPDVVKFLLEIGGRDIIQREKDIVYVAASVYGNRQVVEILLNAGADLHHNDDEALFGAVSERGNHEIVKLLIDRGANVHAQNDKMLINAAWSEENLQTCILLLQNGVRADLHNNEALMKAARSNDDSDIVDLLLSTGVDVTTRDNEALIQASYASKIPILNTLLSHGADIHARNDQALVISASRRNLVAIRFLLSHGANIHAQDDLALIMAAANTRSDDTAAVALLLSAGANVNAQDTMALMVAIPSYNLMKLLFENGADIHAQNDRVLTLVIAECVPNVTTLIVDKMGHEHLHRVRDIDTTLYEAGQGDLPRPRPIRYSEFVKAPREPRQTRRISVIDDALTKIPRMIQRTGDQSIENAEILLKAGADINADNCIGLHYAVLSRNLDLVKYWIEKGSQGITPAITSVARMTFQSHYFHRIDFFKVLLATTPRPNIEYMALCYTARDVDADSLQLLLDHGGDVKLRDVHDQPILSYILKKKEQGRESEQLRTLLCVLKLGVDINELDFVQYIIRQNLQSTTILQTLLEAGAKVSSSHIKLGISTNQYRCVALLSYYYNDRAIYQYDGEHLLLDNIYHGFFNTICEQTDVNPSDLTYLRTLLMSSASLLRLSRSDINRIETAANAPELCQWLREKQNERCQICMNDMEPILMLPIEDTPLMFLYMFQQNNRTFCADIITLTQLISRNATNPWTGEALTSHIITDIWNRYHAVVRLMLNVRMRRV